MRVRGCIVACEGRATGRHSCVGGGRHCCVGGSHSCVRRASVCGRGVSTAWEGRQYCAGGASVWCESCVLSLWRHLVLFLSRSL